MYSIPLIQLCCLLTIYYNLADAIIVSPCKVQNMVTQPSFGTDLKTKGLVQIVQMPPVFVQNVMVGVCENPNQNISTGKIGEFYSCQQRYSAVEVYIAEAPHIQSSNKGDAYQNQKPQQSDYLNSVKFSRESVIIESGCDFTFNLLPLMASVQGQSESQSGAPAISQQKLILRSPFHQSISISRQPGQYADTPIGTPTSYQVPSNAVPIRAPTFDGRSGHQDSSTVDDVVVDEHHDGETSK